MEERSSQMPRKPRRGSRRLSGTPTITDVADRAGVSPMTVSRVINADANVREATRAAVNAAIAELNYAPSRAARSLAGAVQLRIGMLYSNPSAAYLSEFLVGSLDQAGRSDLQLVVGKCDARGEGLEAVTRLVRSGIDGVILPPPLCESAPIRDSLLAANVPMVAVATGQVPDRMSSVRIDDFDAARAMTAHLVELGHARIGFVTGDPNVSASAARAEGYRAALTAAGIAFDPTLVVPGLFTYRSGLDAAERLLDRADPPTAIFASNDDMAAAAVAVAHRRGLDVPGDLTVCGFDDSAIATTIWPELTTIRQPIADMSRAAVELLVDAIRARRGGQEGEVRHLALPYTLVRRQSDAAPRRRPPVIVRG